ncbi:MAG: di-heme oxidoredictase family protein [Chitinophagales bacterium]
MAISSVAIISCNTDPELHSEWYDADAYFAGGETTVFDVSSHAYSSPAPNITGTEFNDMEAICVERSFVTALQLLNGGLGPVFNNTSCEVSMPPTGEVMHLFSASVFPETSAIGGPLAVLGYGTQLQRIKRS